MDLGICDGEEACRDVCEVDSVNVGCGCSVSPCPCVWDLRVEETVCVNQTVGIFLLLQPMPKEVA